MPGLALLPVRLMLDGVQVIELLRRLYERDLFGHEVSKRIMDKIREWDLVGVKNGDKLALGLRERSIDISCFMMLVIRSREIVYSHRFTELTQFRATAIIQYPCLVWVTYIQRPQDRHAQNREILVISGNEDIDCAPAGRSGMRYRFQVPRHE